jgi:hypothetical protein
LGAVEGVADCDVDTTIWLVFKTAQEQLLEGSSEEEAKGHVLDDVGMYFEGNIADLHL